MENKINKILALKYRPQNFKELIGQDIMVETITNSIKLKKLPNAYLLTGIRGTGKTTTARLIAKAINCKKDFIANKIGEYCDCDSCKEITNDRHLDVLEMDAASKTGIDDVRELIESSKYNPTSGKYKIYIIDEIHMLSKQAFNGLLKTLEEPPPHLKFIFATTEVKKIPVTIISRCQRFDLNRVPIAILLENLNRISKIEGGKITEPALKLIAKASEGSVRDSLSLLDRAFVSQNINEKEIDEVFIRRMLGIADRSKLLELINYIFSGDQKKSIEKFKELIAEGLEPENFINDFLEIIYLVQQKKNIGSIDSDLSISESDLEVIENISKEVSTTTLIVFWQFILKSLEELSIVSNPILSVEMLIIRLIHLKDMPSYEKVLEDLNSEEKNIQTTLQSSKQTEKRILKDDKDIVAPSKDQMKSTIQVKPKPEPLEQKVDNESILSFQDLVRLSSLKREIELKYELENNVNLIKFSEGKIDISFNDNLGKNFVRKLSEKLLQWTGKRWVISLTKGEGQESIAKLNDRKKKEKLATEKEGLVYKEFKNLFEDIELIDVKKVE
jgi:DNA polymerase III subunit gamma/tau